MAKKDKNKPATDTRKTAGGGLVKTSPQMLATGAGSSGSLMPAGLGMRALAGDADATDEMMDIAPTFGAVLTSIGTGVVSSQALLDQGIIESAKKLGNTTIDVVTDVIQELDDDGYPIVKEVVEGDPNSPLIKHKVSLINYVRPTVHQWQHVALSMDLSVGEMTRETGMTFSKSQNSHRVSTSGGLWGFLGWFNHDSTWKNENYQRNTEQESDWAQGQVRLDAKLAPREISDFPRPFQSVLGPQIFISQGAQTEGEENDILTRTTELYIKVLSKTGAVNSNVVVTCDSGAFRHSFVNDDEHDGSRTNTSGEVKIMVARDIPSVSFARPMTETIRVNLGQITQTYELKM